MVPEVVVSRNIGSVYQSNCFAAKETLGLFSGSNASGVEQVLDGLKVKYTNDLDINQYLDLLDGKTTRAVRQALKQILKDPLTAKFSERLNSRIYEYNSEVEEVAKTRVAKFFNAVSEIAVYGTNKLVEQKSEGFLKLTKEQKTTAKEIIASSMVDAYSTLKGNGWSVAQIYKTRCKIDALKVAKSRCQ